jgi:predicted dehydrogenase
MKVLIIGLGSIAKKHIAALKEIDTNIKIHAFRSSLSSKPYEDVIDIYNFDNIASEEYDFCIISTPTANHLEDIKKLKLFNIPLFIEKPLFDKVLKTEINDLDVNVLTYTACNLRFLDCLQYVKSKFLNDKNLIVNEVNSYCGSYLPEWRPGTDYKKCYSANADMGGGVHLDLIHEIDYIYWMFGQPNVSSKTLRQKSTLDINSIDYANYILTYDRFACSIILNYFRRDAKRYVEIVFNEFTIKADIINNKVYKNDCLIYESKQKSIETYKVQLNYFIDCVKNNKPTFNNMNEAYEVLNICI